MFSTMNQALGASCQTWITDIIVLRGNFKQKSTDGIGNIGHVTNRPNITFGK